MFSVRVYGTDPGDMTVETLTLRPWGRRAVELNSKEQQNKWIQFAFMTTLEGDASVDARFQNSPCSDFWQ